MAGEERRRSPRIKDEELALEVKLDDFDEVTHTLDVSTSGLYCKIDKEIPLMSRVKLVLMIPDPSKDGADIESLEVTGVIVREHPVIINGQIKHYDAAIFFEDLTPRDKDILSAYIAKKAVLNR